MKTQLERAREKHADLVKLHARCHDQYNKKMDAAFRYRTKMQQAERAIARSQKRLDLLMAATTHTNGPTASVVVELVEEVAAKSAPVMLDDPIPEFSEPVQAVPKRKRRRTPDDFVADMKARQ